MTTDEDQLRELNERFLAACRTGSWEQLRPVLSASFGYVDGATGQLWEQDRYVADLRASPSPSLLADQVVVRVAGDVAVVTARSGHDDGRANRYLDVYARETGQWRCVHATVWPALTGEQAHGEPSSA